MLEPFLFRHFDTIVAVVLVALVALAALSAQQTQSCIDRVSETCAAEGIRDTECLARVQIKCRLVE